jgi:hypothetical protein
MFDKQWEHLPTSYAIILSLSLFLLQKYYRKIPFLSKP